MNKNTLIIGASLNPARMSNRVTHELQENGETVYALGLRAGKIGDVMIETDREKFRYKKVHTVGMYINPKLQPPFYEYILSLKPERIYFNPGTENPELFQLAKEAGIEPMYACLMVALTVGTF